MEHERGQHLVEAVVLVGEVLSVGLVKAHVEPACGGLAFCPRQGKRVRVRCCEAGLRMLGLREKGQVASPAADLENVVGVANGCPVHQSPVQSRYPGQPLDDVIQREQRVVPEARQVVVPAVQIGLRHQPLTPSRLWDRAGLAGPRRNRRLGLAVPSTTLTTRKVAETAGPTA
jgi:hypothetical protein